jgi:hypothetical protein
VNIPGATNAALFFRGATTDMSGSYTVLISTPAGTIASASATLTVQPAPPDAAVAFFGSSLQSRLERRFYRTVQGP